MAALGAFTEAIAPINKDKKCAAQIYLNLSGGRKSTVADFEKQLEDVNIAFATTPIDAGTCKSSPSCIHTSQTLNCPARAAQ